MKKLYQTPNMELTVVYAQDVITTSIEQYDALLDPYASDKDSWN